MNAPKVFWKKHRCWQDNPHDQKAKDYSLGMLSNQHTTRKLVRILCGGYRRIAIYEFATVSCLASNYKHDMQYHKRIIIKN